MKNKILMFIIVAQVALFTGADAQTNVGISALSTFTPDASAILDISSTTLGLLIPRMATNPITTPANGLIIYNTTTNTLNNNIGTSTVPNWSSIWGSAGDNLTSSGNQFLGSTTLIDLRFRTNNIERMAIDSSTGFVGIGLPVISATVGSIPNSTLQINGSFSTAVLPVSSTTPSNANWAISNLILVSPSGAITLPTTSLINGRIYTIKSTGAGSITINLFSTTQTVDGGTTAITLTSTAALYKFITIQTDGSVWYIIANN